MPTYKYLGKQGFPHADNVNVYDYTNDLDYSRFDYSQMSIQVCSVPWEQGEAHIGQRTLEGIGNVVYFGSEEARNAYFDAIPDSECFRWETKFKELHSDLTLRVPLPFDVACNYNYVRVSYNFFANDESPLLYESDDGMRIWHYFIREVRFVAPNTTELVLLDDAWQTWIYRINITNMILARGHAPLFATPTDTYLLSPIDNCADLLADDINFGELQRVSNTQATALNASNVVAVFIVSSEANGSWGSRGNNDWITPAASSYSTSGVPNMFVFAIEVSDLDLFLQNSDLLNPQFKQSVQCIFFCESGLLTFGSTFTFNSVECRIVSDGGKQTKTIFQPNKASWGYDARYADLAKLYTYPYSALEITNERGESELVRIEDTSGLLTMDVVSNIVFPYINLWGNINGIGGATSTVLSFQNVTSKTFSASGRWYEHLYRWEVPTFAVVISAKNEYEYSSHFDRIQMDNDRTTEKGNTNRSAANAYTNAITQAGTIKSNADATAGTIKSNADSLAGTTSTNAQNVADAGYTAAEGQANASYTSTDTIATANQANEGRIAQNAVNNALAQTTANTAITATGNAAATEDARLANQLAQAIQAWDAGLTRDTVNNQIQAANATTAISAAGAVINNAASGALSGAASGGAVGAGIGVLAGIGTGGISAALSLATNAVAMNAATTQAENIVSNTQNKLNETKTSNVDRTANANTAKTNQTNSQNTAISTTATNTSNTITTNAQITYNAVTGAADTVRDAAIDAADTVRDAQVSAATALETTTKNNNTATYNTATGNNLATYNTATTVALNNKNTSDTNALATYNNAGARIDNLVNQANLRAPFVFGRVDSADLASSKPMALFVNIVTESDYAIQKAGDEFLRYGYMYDKQWEFDGNWCIGDHFTFWQLRDYWATNQIPDRFADQIRFLLFGGITIWSNPNDIGRTSIYDNGI